MWSQYLAVSVMFPDTYLFLPFAEIKIIMMGNFVWPSILQFFSSKRMEQFLTANSFDKEALLKESYAMYMQALSQELCK